MSDEELLLSKAIEETMIENGKHLRGWWADTFAKQVAIRVQKATRLELISEIEQEIKKMPVENSSEIESTWGDDWLKEKEVLEVIEKLRKRELEKK